MKLTKLLERLEYRCLQGETDIEVRDISNDSRKAGRVPFFSV